MLTLTCGTSWTDIVSYGVLPGAAVLGVVVAYLGLVTWKRQLKGTAEYELARRMLSNTYRLRDAMRGVRQPWILPDEVVTALTDQGVKDTAEEALRNRAVYAERWNRVSAAWRELAVEVTEAEVLWSLPEEELTSGLRKCTGKLYSAVMRFFDPEVQPGAATQTPGLDQRWRATIYAQINDSDPDEFRDELEAAVRQVEKIVRPHLKR